MYFSELTVQLISIVGLAAAIATTLSYCKIPTIVGFIIAGLCIGPYGFEVVKNFPGIDIINEIGLSLLMFTVGLEFAYEKIRYLSKSLLGLGLGMILSVIAFVTILGLAIGLGSWQYCVMVGMILSLSSSAIVLKLLQQDRELETPHGNASVGILLAQDVVFAPMIMLIPFLFNDTSTTVAGKVGSHHDLSSLIIFLGCCLLLFLLTKYALGRLFWLVLKTRNQELFFFVLLFLFGLIAFGTKALIGSLSLGAFIAGLCFANSPLAKQALSDILPLRDTFLALLFTSVGMLVDLSFFKENLANILATTFVILLIKPLIVYVIGRCLHYSHAICLTVGLLTFQVGEFSIVLIKELWRRQHFAEPDMQFFLCITVLTMALTPFIRKLSPQLIKLSGFLEHIKFPSILSSAQSSYAEDLHQHLDDHTLIVGYGVAGQQLGNVLQSMDIAYVACELNYSAVMKAQKHQLPVIFGDAQRAEILHIAGIETARCIVITIPAIQTAANIINAARTIRPYIPVIIRVEYERGVAALKHFPAIELVVAEHESTLQVLSKTLQSYAIDQKTIISHIVRLKTALQDAPGTGLANSMPDLLPFLSKDHLLHLTIPTKAFAIGQSIHQLKLNQLADVKVLAIQKKLSPPALPSGDDILAAGDTLYFHSSDSSFERIQAYLISGPSPGDPAPPAQD